MTTAIQTVLQKIREGELVGGESKAEDEDEAEDEAEVTKERRRFELPFVAYYRKEDWASCLTLAQLSSIPELDREYYHVQTAKAGLLRSSNSMFSHDADVTSRVRRELRLAESLPDVLDVEAWLTHEHEAQVGSAADELAEATGGPRRATKRGLYYVARKGGAVMLMEKFGLSVQQLAENVCTHFSQEQLPLDEILTPTEVRSSAGLLLRWLPSPLASRRSAPPLALLRPRPRAPCSLARSRRTSSRRWLRRPPPAPALRCQPSCRSPRARSPRRASSSPTGSPRTSSCGARRAHT